MTLRGTLLDRRETRLRLWRPYRQVHQRLVT